MSFYNSADLGNTEIKTRMTAEDGLLTFGVDLLDDAMNGIMRNDLILVGARSGAGKTQFCCNVAWANAQQGKRVHYFALEAEHAEIERRMKYRIFSSLYFKKQNRPQGERLTFRNWMLGRLSIQHADIEAQTTEIFAEAAKTMFTFYKQDKFDVMKFIEMVLYCANETDLIIVDHVHYFDMSDDNENRAVKEIAMAARNLSVSEGKPIILVSHLRKTDRFNTDKAPGQEEFHGSSDLYKISTKCITLARGDHYTPDGKSETFIRIAKDRFDGSLEYHLGRIIYNTKEGKYEPGYTLGPIKQKRGEEFEEYPSANYPDWARSQRATRSESHLPTNTGQATTRALRNWAVDYKSLPSKD